MSINTSLVEPAINKLVNDIKPNSKGYYGWSNPNADLSRTVTAQVLIALSKYTEQVQLPDKKLLETIAKGFNFLNNSILVDRANCELATLTYSIEAHVEHHLRYPIEFPLNVDFIALCIGEIKKDFYSVEKKAYKYFYSSRCEVFTTHLALKAYSRLLYLLEKNPTIKISNYDKDFFLNEIDNSFLYIYENAKNSLLSVQSENFEKIVPDLAIGIELSKLCEEYSLKYNRIPDYSKTLFNVNKAVSFFWDKLESDVKTNWQVKIDDCPFRLAYVANLVVGLSMRREQLDDTGFNLLYSLSLFICSDQRIQSFNANKGIVHTNYPAKSNPIWATAHTLNAILSLNQGVNELKWVNDKKETPSVAMEQKVNSLERSHNTLFYQIILPITTSLVASVAYAAFIQKEQEMPIKGFLGITITLFFITTFIYFIPRMFKSIATGFSFLEKHEKTISLIGYLLMIIAYTFIIFYYATKFH